LWHEKRIGLGARRGVKNTWAAGKNNMKGKIRKIQNPRKNLPLYGEKTKKHGCYRAFSENVWLHKNKPKTQSKKKTPISARNLFQKIDKRSWGHGRGKKKNRL